MSQDRRADRDAQLARAQAISHDPDTYNRMVRGIAAWAEYAWFAREIMRETVVPAILAAAERGAQLHRRFKSKHVRGEWYDLSESDLGQL